MSSPCCKLLHKFSGPPGSELIDNLFLDLADADLI